MPHYFINDKLIFTNGRILWKENNAHFSWSGTSFSFLTESRSITIHFQDHPCDNHKTYFTVLVDGKEHLVFSPSKCSKGFFTLEFPQNTNRLIRIIKRSEPLTGHIVFTGIDSETDFLPLPESFLNRKKIEFIGDSLTCGYGCEENHSERGFRAETENVCGSFAGLTAELLNAEYRTIAWSGRGVIRNWDDAKVRFVPDLYSSTVPESGIPWDFSVWRPDLVVINLGSNDYSQGPVDENDYIEGILNLLRTVRAQYGAVPVVFPLGCTLTNDGQTNRFTGKIYPALDLYCIVMEKFRQKALNLGLNPVFTLTLTGQDQIHRGTGADKHPNLVQNQLNAKELTQFILSNHFL